MFSSEKSSSGDGVTGFDRGKLGCLHMGKESKTHFSFFARPTQSSSRDYASAAAFDVFLLEIASNWSEAAENTITLSVSNGPK